MNAQRRSPGSRWLRATVRVAVLVLSVPAAAGCGGLFHGSSSEPGATYASDPVTVHVENRSWDLVTVSVLSGVHRRRLGQVGSQQSKDFVVPSTVLTGTPAEMRLLAQPTGSSRSYASNPILVGPDDRVEWTLQVNLFASTVEVR